MRFWNQHRRNEIKPVPRRSATGQVSVPRYPPVDEGLPAASLDELLSTHTDMLRRLRTIVAEPDDRFATHYRVPVERLLRWVHLLPASRSEIFIGAGGLASFALQLALGCSQSAEGVIFAGSASVELRRRLEPRWRYAAFLCGLLSELWRPASLCRVVLDDGTEWPSYQLPLLDWLLERNAQRYFVRWLTPPQDVRRARGLGVHVGQSIVPLEVMEDLARNGSREIVETVLGLLAGSISESDDHPLVRVVRGTRERVIGIDRALRPDLYGALTVGVHLEPHLLDAMRGLVADGTWLVNQPRARLHYGLDGLFVAWSTGHEELQRRLKTAGIAAAPKDEQTVRETLERAGVISRGPDGSTLWDIHPRGHGERVVAVRFNDPTSLLGSLPVAPLQVRFVIDAAPVVVRATQQTEAQAQQPLKLDASSDAAAPVVEKEAAPAATKASPAATPAATTRPAPAASSSDAPAAPVATGDPPATKARRSAARPTQTELLASDGSSARDKLRLPKELAVKMGRLPCLALEAMLNDWAQGKTVAAAWTERGLAFDPAWPSALGIEPSNFLDALFDQGWLVTNPDKPLARVVDVEADDGPKRWCVLKADIAQRIGFVRRPHAG
jgi:conjugal transfer pilus assembly protein TraI